MTETSLGWHQVGCSRCVDQRWRSTCHQMLCCSRVAARANSLPACNVTQHFKVTYHTVTHPWPLLHGHCTRSRPTHSISWTSYAIIIAQLSHAARYHIAGRRCGLL